MSHKVKKKNSSRPSSNINLFKLASFLLGKEKSTLFWSIFGAVIASVLAIAVAAFPALFIERILNTEISYAVRIIISFALIIMVAQIVTYYDLYRMSLASAKRSARISHNLFEHVLKIDQEYLENSAFMEKYQRILDNMLDASSGFFTSINKIISSAIIIVSIGSFFIITDRIIMIFVILLAGIDVLTGLKISKVEYDKTVAMSEFTKRSGVINRMFMLSHSLREFKTFSAESFALTKANEHWKLGMKTESKFHKLLNFLQGLGFASGNLISLAVMIVFAVLVLRDDISAAAFFLNIALFVEFSESAKSMVEIIPSIRKINLFSGDYFDFLNDEKIISSYIVNGIALEKVESIELLDVSFRYSSSDVNALTKVNLKIDRGEKIAIAGTNGEGKSTLIKVISGFYKATEGTVLINGVPIEKYNTACIRRNVSILFQDYFIFPYAISDNFIKDESVNDILLEKLDFFSFTKHKDLPMELDTGIGSEFNSNHTELSGGEKQKLAIVRALLKNKDTSTLIMDEPMNNLDMYTESKMYKEVLDDNDGTVIIVSHQMSFMEKMDKIVVMENGSIIQQGNHTELISLKNGKYSMLFNKYRSKYAVEVNEYDNSSY